RSMDDFGTRNRIVIQTRDMPQLERQVHRGLPVRSIKIAVVDGIVVKTQSYVEGCLDGRDRALELYVHSIARAAGHDKTVRLRKTNYFVIILLAGTEYLSKLLHRE